MNFTSSPVASISVSELPIDSLDLNKKKSTKKSLVINDDNDCETVVLSNKIYPFNVLFDIRFNRKLNFKMVKMRAKKKTRNSKTK